MANERHLYLHIIQQLCNYPCNMIIYDVIFFQKSNFRKYWHCSYIIECQCDLLTLFDLSWLCFCSALDKTEREKKRICNCNNRVTQTETGFWLNKAFSFLIHDVIHFSLNNEPQVSYFMIRWYCQLFRWPLLCSISFHLSLFYHYQKINEFL